MQKSRVLVQIALFAALTCALTLFPSIPIQVTGIPGGYVHLGDAVILLSAYFIGRKSIFSAAVGSALADMLIGGAMIYAPATLFIKALMAFVAFCIIKHKENSLLLFVAAALCAETIMLMGYFLYETIIYSATLALASAAAGLVQFVGSVILAVTIFSMVRGTKLKQMLQGF